MKAIVYDKRYSLSQEIPNRLFGFATGSPISGQ